MFWKKNQIKKKNTATHLKVNFHLHQVTSVRINAN